METGAAERRAAAIAMLRRAASTREAQNTNERSEALRKLTSSPLPGNRPQLRRSRTLPTLSTLANLRAAALNNTTNSNSNNNTEDVKDNLKAVDDNILAKATATTTTTEAMNIDNDNDSLKVFPPTELHDDIASERLMVRQNLMRKLSERHLRRRSKSLGALTNDGRPGFPIGLNLPLNDVSPINHHENDKSSHNDNDTDNNNNNNSKNAVKSNGIHRTSPIAEEEQDDQEESESNDFHETPTVLPSKLNEIPTDSSKDEPEIEDLTPKFVPSEIPPEQHLQPAIDSISTTKDATRTFPTATTDEITTTEAHATTMINASTSTETESLRSDVNDTSLGSSGITGPTNTTMTSSTSAPTTNAEDSSPNVNSEDHHRHLHDTNNENENVRESKRIISGLSSVFPTPDPSYKFPAPPSHRATPPIASSASSAASSSSSPPPNQTQQQKQQQQQQQLHLRSAITPSPVDRPSLLASRFKTPSPKPSIVRKPAAPLPREKILNKINSVIKSNIPLSNPSSPSNVNNNTNTNGSPKTNTPIDNPPRRFLEHGPIFQVIDHSSIKRRYLFLFSDCLLVAKPVPSADGMQIDHHNDPLSCKFIPKALISLDGLSITDTAHSFTNNSRTTNPTTQTLMISFAKSFASDSQHALETLLSKSSASAWRTDNLARIIVNTVTLDPVHIANYLCLTENEQILKHFIDHLKLHLFDIDNALRILLAFVKLPHHVATVEKFLQAFAARYVHGQEQHFANNNNNNNKGPLSPQTASSTSNNRYLTYDIVYKLIFSLMELDDALHSGLQSPYEEGESATNGSDLALENGRNGYSNNNSPELKPSSRSNSPNDKRSNTNAAASQGFQNKSTRGLFSFPNPAISQNDFVDAFRIKDPEGIIDSNKLGSLYRSIKRIPLAQPSANPEFEAPKLFQSLSSSTSSTAQASPQASPHTPQDPLVLTFGTNPLPEKLIYRRASPRITLSMKTVAPLRVKLIAAPHLRIQLINNTSKDAQIYSSSSKQSSEVYLSYAATTSYSFDILPTQLDGPHIVYFVLLGPASSRAHFAGDHAVTRPFVWKFNVQREFMANTFVLTFPRSASPSKVQQQQATTSSSDNITPESNSSHNNNNNNSSSSSQQQEKKQLTPKRKYCFSASENYQAHMKWITWINQRIEATKARSKPRLRAQYAAEHVAWTVLTDAVFGKDQKLQTAPQGNNGNNNNPSALRPHNQGHRKTSSRTSSNSNNHSHEDEDDSELSIQTGYELVTLIRQNSLLPGILALLNAGAEVAPHPVNDSTATAYHPQNDVHLNSHLYQSHKRTASDVSVDRSGWL